MALLVMMSVASVWLTSGLEKLGARLRFREALLGILTALGAEAPEISSAISALYFDHREVAFGVVLGSNIFNLAGPLGLSALMAGRVEIGRHGLLLTGVVGVLILARISSWLTLVMPFLSLVPYLFLASFRPQHLERFLAERDERRRAGGGEFSQRPPPGRRRDHRWVLCYLCCRDRIVAMNGEPRAAFATSPRAHRQGRRGRKGHRLAQGFIAKDRLQVVTLGR
jgi:hypothetical protein